MTSETLLLHSSTCLAVHINRHFWLYATVNKPMVWSWSDFTRWRVKKVRQQLCIVIEIVTSSVHLFMSRETSDYWVITSCCVWLAGSGSHHLYVGSHHKHRHVNYHITWAFTLLAVQLDPSEFKWRAVLYDFVCVQQIDRSG